MERNSQAKMLKEELEYYTNLLRNYNAKIKEKPATVKCLDAVPSRKLNGGHSFSAFKIDRNIPQNAKGMSVSTNYQPKGQINCLNSQKNPYFKDKRRVFSAGNKNVFVQSAALTYQSAKKTTVPHHVNSFSAKSISSRISENTIFNPPGCGLKAVSNKSLFSDKETKTSSPRSLVAEISAITKQLKETSESFSCSNKSKLSKTNSVFCTSVKLASQNCDNSGKGSVELLKKDSTVEKSCYRASSYVSSNSISCDQNKGKGCDNIKSDLLLALNNSCAKVPSVMTGDKISYPHSLNMCQNKNKPATSFEKVNSQFQMSSPESGRGEAILGKQNLNCTPVSSRYKSALIRKNIVSSRKKSKVTSKLIATKYKLINKNSELMHPIKHQICLENKTTNRRYVAQVNNFKVLNMKIEKNTVCKKTPLKKVSRKLNLKHKIINKTLTPCINKNEIVKYQLTEDMKKTKFVKQLKIQSPDQKPFNIDLSSKKNSKFFHVHGVGLNVSQMSSKIPTSIKTLEKIPSILNSKYKVINKICCSSGRLILKLKTDSSANGHQIANKGKISRFSIINRSSLNKLSTPFVQKHVLLKRIYKSKNVIINKNYKPVNHTARMIKTKYFTLNKKKINFCQNISRNTVVSKLKGHHSNGHFHPRNKVFRKTVGASSFNYSITRRQSKHKSVTISAKHFPGKNFTRYKLCSRIQNKRFVVNSSGRKLKRVTYSNGNKMFKRLSYGKAHLRSSNMLKSVSPVSKDVASRVLHRSINRALTASMKKKLTKVNRYCMFYNRFGRCNKGIKCPYVHDPSKIAVCTRFLRGTCKTDNCPFSHEICPGKMAICSFFLLGVCNKSNCPYRHETLSPDTELCKAFVQGYCRSGKQCKKAHILICPQYVQGTCKKGDSCAFPHPPQKTKKNIQDMDDKNVNEDAQELYERYFQQFSAVVTAESENNDSCISLIASRSFKLPEQPAYIPLTESTS